MISTSALLIRLFWGKGARWGSGIERTGAFLCLPEKVLTSLVLLDTLKNNGLARVRHWFFSARRLRASDGLGRFHDRLRQSGLN
jgi:hypothetical protein